MFEESYKGYSAQLRRICIECFEVFCVYQESTVLFQVAMDYSIVLEMYRQFPHKNISIPHLYIHIGAKLDLFQVSQYMNLFVQY